MAVKAKILLFKHESATSILDRLRPDWDKNKDFHLIQKDGTDLAVNLDALAINVIVNIIVLSPLLWLSGRAIVGKKKAKFTDALFIVIVGTVVGALFGAFFVGFLASIIQLILWLLTVRYFFDCGWWKALAISILAIIIFAIIAVVLGLLGFTLIQFV